jgi:putative FmdB family regulatory protein
MPIYEYLCADCEEKFEKYVRAWGDGVSCPSCQGSAVEKQLSTFAFSGVGSGQDGGYSRSVGGGCGCGRGGCGCAH